MFCANAARESPPLPVNDRRNGQHQRAVSTHREDLDQVDGVCDRLFVDVLTDDDDDDDDGGVVGTTAPLSKEDSVDWFAPPKLRIADARDAHVLRVLASAKRNNVRSRVARHNEIANLGAFAVRPMYATTATDSPSGPRLLGYPPYEYSSAMMYQCARATCNKAVRVSTPKQRPRQHALADLPMDKGGTVKNILQSNKSLLHYLVTYPLNNTWRAYIQLGPRLPPTHIAMPRHRVTQLFAVDWRRDKARAIWRSQALRRNEEWTDDTYDCYFEPTVNFALVLKRDPCIYNGSVALIDRVYALNAPESECVHVSPFTLHNLNADFDGDTVTVLAVRGVESSIEINECLREPLLYGGRPRHTFNQSLVYNIFRILCTWPVDANESDESAWSNGVSAKRALLQKLHLAAREARRRAKRVFGSRWFVFYAAISRRYISLDTRENDPSWWQRPIWSQPILDVRPDRARSRSGCRIGLLAALSVSSARTATSERHADVRRTHPVCAQLDDRALGCKIDSCRSRRIVRPYYVVYSETRC